MYAVEFTSKMKRDVKRMRKRGKDMSKLLEILELLASGKPTPAKYRDHVLSGELRGIRELHIEPDWLLLYQIHRDVLILTATGTGTHADLFGE